MIAYLWDRTLEAFPSGWESFRMEFISGCWGDRVNSVPAWSAQISCSCKWNKQALKPVGSWAAVSCDLFKGDHIIVPGINLGIENHNWEQPYF